MATRNRKKRIKRILIIAGGIFLLLFTTLIVLAEFYVEPALRKRLQTLIVEGSDSLYTYKIGSLKASLLGGRVEVNDLEIQVDSNRYNLLKTQNKLPALILQLNIQKASISGINIFSLLFSKKVFINEISSKQSDIKLYRFPKKRDSALAQDKQPLWKAIQGKIKGVEVNTIKLDGIKLLYKNAEGSEAAKIQFDRCDAMFENIRIDSSAVVDTTRIGYVKNFSFRLNGLKFRTNDSTYKMKAEWITYNSATRLLQIDSFKLQPTLKKEERVDSMRKSWYTLTFDRVDFKGLRLDRFLRLNRAEADSVIFQKPALSIYQDQRGEKSYKSKIGHYPHQELLGADADIAIKGFAAHNMHVDVQQLQEDGQEGIFALDDLDVSVSNVVNDPVFIKQNPVCTATANGKIIGSPIQAFFRFYLDSADGRFDVNGKLENVNASQINPISSTLANVQVPSANIDLINFFVRGEDFGAVADVQMRYSNLSVVFLKRDKETGENSTRNFLNKLVNKYAIYTSNPSSGAERRADGVRAARLTTQSFFGMIWQAVFAGMQNIILKTG